MIRSRFAAARTQGNSPAAGPLRVKKWGMDNKATALQYSTVAFDSALFSG
jgi:hypothetical protein